MTASLYLTLLCALSRICFSHTTFVAINIHFALLAMRRFKTSALCSIYDSLRKAVVVHGIVGILSFVGLAVALGFARPNMKVVRFFPQLLLAGFVCRSGQDSTLQNRDSIAMANASKEVRRLCVAHKQVCVLTQI